jgi:hypothetical protein
MNAVAMRAARAAQFVELQQAARERDAFARHAAKATQPAEQLLNNSKQSGNGMLLPGVLPRQLSLLTSGKQPGEGLAPGELGSKPWTLR